MEKDRFGNLIFDNKTLGDPGSVYLINSALDKASGSFIDPPNAGKRQPDANKQAKAMIDAGALPNAEDLSAIKALSLEERIGRFVRGAHRIPLLVIREDELEDVCEQLRTQPLDHDLFAREYHRGERSEQASKLADTIQSLEPGEAATFIS